MPARGTATLATRASAGSARLGGSSPRIPNCEVLSYDCTHFEPYLDPYFDQIAPIRSTSSTAASGTPGDRHAIMAAHVHTLIVGAGFAGIAAAAVLRDDPTADVLIIERADGVGARGETTPTPGVRL
jgi:NADPH-dependent 2,4-dienoyl-CoA reductase/sulfur reductase-like enzyme